MADVSLLLDLVFLACRINIQSNYECRRHDTLHSTHSTLSYAGVSPLQGPSTFLLPINYFVVLLRLSCLSFRMISAETKIFFSESIAYFKISSTFALENNCGM